ncbi:HEAT repeat domain-containing protein, partial [Streptomyces massasporeus]|uniref:HEAT repeat domain-containing protein n=1 Tax=Streptomyces massasporeus TaxID=67324 RepID=UPI003701C8AE
MRAALEVYALRVRQTYAHLELDVLTPLSDQGDHPPVALREVFVVPGLRADPPPVELPRELVYRLIESGDLMQEPGASQETTQSPVEEAEPSQETEFLAEVRKAIEQLKDAYRRKPVVGALTVLASEGGRRIVLLGDPGAGKSTLARYLALTLTRTGTLDGSLTALVGHVPLIIELREYAAAEWRQRTFEDFIAHLHATRGMAPPPALTRQLLLDGRALVVFDGLDELFEPRIRHETHHRIAAFATRYPAARVIVTSRTIGYQRTVLDNAGFSHHMLQDLDGPQISDFAHRWYALSCRHDAGLADRLAGQLVTAVTSSRPVRELAGNPLLLTILAIIGRRKVLPRDRRGVYEHAVTVLVAHWDQQAKHLEAQLPDSVASTLDALGERERTRLLQLLARAMQEGTGGIAGNHIHGSDLERLIGDHLRARYEIPPPLAATCSRAMVAQLRERNFILSRYGGEVYGFVHRAFLEYLAATDIIQRIKDDWDRTPKQYAEEIVTEHAADPAWHEVLLLLIGELGERAAAAAVDRILLLHSMRSDPSDVSHVVLALRSLAEVGAVGGLSKQSIAVVDAVTALLDEATGEMKSSPSEGVAPRNSAGAPEGSAYADILMPRHSRLIREDSDEYSPRLPAAAAAFQTFGPYWIGRERFLRWYHLRGQFADYGTEPAQLTVALRPEPAELRRLAANSFYRQDREIFLKALADGWISQRDTQEFVADRLLYDPNPEVRLRAAVLLRGCSVDHHQLLERLSTEPQGRVRCELVDMLVGQWPHRPEVRTRLTNHALNDPDTEVRNRVVEGLIQRWPDREDLHDLLVAVADTDAGPAPVAARALADRATWQEDLYPVLAHLAEWHPLHLVRGALLPLVLDRCNDDDARGLLSTRAVCDEKAQLREAAIKTLMRMWPQDDGVRTLCRNRASEDPSAVVRRAALTAWIADAEHEEARTILALRASGDPEPDLRSQALRLLLDKWPESEETWTQWEQCMRRDENDTVRQSAILTLREVDRRRADVRQALVATALDDTSPAVRSMAATTLAQGWDGPGVLEVLLTLGGTDAAAQVRLDAITLLCAGRAQDEEIVSFLAERVRDDTHPSIRVLALTGLIDAYIDDVHLEALLTDRLCQDPEQGVRRAVLDAWLAGTGLPTITTSVLQTVAAEDTDDSLRQKALLHLLNEHIDDQDTQAFLTDRL